MDNRLLYLDSRVTIADLLPIKPRTRAVWVNFERRRGPHQTWKESRQGRNLAASRQFTRSIDRCSWYQRDISAKLPVPPAVTAYVPADKNYRVGGLERSR